MAYFNETLKNLHAAPFFYICVQGGTNTCYDPRMVLRYQECGGSFYAALCEMSPQIVSSSDASYAFIRTTPLPGYKESIILCAQGTSCHFSLYVHAQCLELIAPGNTTVLCAGEVKLTADRQIISWNNQSGTFMPCAAVALQSGFPRGAFIDFRDPASSATGSLVVAVYHKRAGSPGLIADQSVPAIKVTRISLY